MQKQKEKLHYMKIKPSFFSSIFVFVILLGLKTTTGIIENVFEKSSFEGVLILILIMTFRPILSGYMLLMLTLFIHNMARPSRAVLLNTNERTFWSFSIGACIGLVFLISILIKKLVI